MIMMKNLVLMTIDAMMAIGKLCGGVPPSRGDIPLLYIADEHYTDNKMGKFTFLELHLLRFDCL